MHKIGRLPQMLAVLFPSLLGLAELQLQFLRFDSPQANSYSSE